MAQIENVIMHTSENCIKGISESNIKSLKLQTNLRSQTSSFSCSKIGARGSRFTMCVSFSSWDSPGFPLNHNAIKIIY